MERHKSFIVLCVDDEEMPLFLRKKVLEKAGYDVLAATSAKEAIALAEEHEIDLVVTDQLMPEVVGTELARVIKTLHPLVPVILLSGVNDIPVDAECADLFVSKLEGPSALCHKVKELLEQPRKLRA
jgi:CheY-like chemotaxis protein